MQAWTSFAQQHGLNTPHEADSIYFGGGTPSLLPPELVSDLFQRIRQHWTLSADAEITMEAAPGQIGEPTLQEMLRQGISRVSLGVQSFIDLESASVGRLHTRAQCLAELQRLRSSGIENLGLDLICGLPHQTLATWRETLQVAIDSGVEHISVYMLEVDEDSRLGREILHGGPRYRATVAPSEDVVADMYLMACEMLNGSGITQYEISNFARSGRQSRHNRKYWERAPYLGFGLDAHSMLQSQQNLPGRFANTDDLDRYVAGDLTVEVDVVTLEEAFEEAVFLGLRLIEGISYQKMQQEFGTERVQQLWQRAAPLAQAHWIDVSSEQMRLTSQGRILSSSVFGELLAVPA